ncbi:F0F1 ATP synthase subunit gamma [Phocaeicola coprocola]|uniref:F0F1 ATP synthase subunit gamma n=1 Tax=Phocaeicola coprocola TaxID=310298 RepID=UPI00397C6EF6
MASLKEVKGRINSINGTLKITSAMKMVASSKLHKAQEAIENMLPYERRLHHMLTNFLNAGLSVESPFVVKRDVKKIAIVVFASNSSLCGGFNVNVIRHLSEMLEEYIQQLGKENILVYPIGRKVADAVKKLGITPMGDYQHMSGKPNYKEASDLAAELMDRFVSGEIQQVEMLYNHFKSTSTQVLTRETYLPINLAQASTEEKQEKGMQADYIIEPSAEKVMQELLPKVLRMKMYTVLLDSNAAEHAARTMAMQIATDNANELIQDLTLIYNKSRQQAITNELLDIIGGTMA